MQDRDLNGAGPFEFEPPALDPGDSQQYDFRKLEKGRYRRWLPFDVVNFVNESVERVEVEINGVYNTRVPGNQVRAWNETGVNRVRLWNRGGATIASGDFAVEVQAEPFGADEQARRNAEGNWLNKAANSIIPGGVPDAFR